MARRRTRNERGSKGIRWGRIGGALVLALLVVFIGGYLWLRSYLHSESFRQFLAAQVGVPLRATAAFTPFRWDGLQLSAEAFDAKNGPVVTRLRADGLQTEIGLGGVSRGVWELKAPTINRLVLEVDATSGLGPIPADQPSPAGQPSPVTQQPPGAQVLPAGQPAPALNPPAPPASQSWLSSWVPQDLEVQTVTISEAAVTVNLLGGPLRAHGQKWRIEPSASAGSYRMEATGGRLSGPWPLLQDAKVDHMILQFRPGSLYLTDAEFAVGQNAKLTLSGEVGLDDGRYGFEGSLKDLKAEEILPVDWKKRLIGDLQAKFSVAPASDGAVTRGELEMKNGILTALPVLDRLAAYADVERFRTLNLRTAKLKFVREASQLTLTDIEIGSEGLVRLEGRMVIRGEALDGRFRLGITPGTLARIPGAETKVFLPGERGLLWTELHITGTIDAPQEDLTERLIIAAGERMFEILPESGQKALKFAGSAASQGAVEILEGAGTILGTGGTILEGVKPIQEIGERLFPLIPGLGN
jgi:hypothetical protein